MDIIQKKLAEFKTLVEEGLDAENMVRALKLIGIEGYDTETVSSFKLWNDYMPLSDDHPYTAQQRYLHVLWDSIDRVPLGVNCDFAIPFRQIIAKRLFKKCGEGFVANEGCRFNFGNRIEVGDNVSWNAGCYIDSKGGVKFGDYSMIDRKSVV